MSPGKRRPVGKGPLLMLALSVLAITACAPGAVRPAAPTSCGGSHEWPPNGYPLAPAGLSVEIISGTTVRVRNDTDDAVVARIAPWQDLTCVGYMTTEAPRYDLGPSETVEGTVTDPGWGGALRIGVEFYRSGCLERCQETPFGFAYVDPAARTPSS